MKFSPLVAQKYKIDVFYENDFVTFFSIKKPILNELAFGEKLSKMNYNIT